MMIKSLHIKLSLSVAAAALFVVILSSYFFYKRSYENSFADSERSVRQLLETVSNTAAIAAYVGNRELAQEVVAGLSINDIVVGAQIRAGRMSPPKQYGDDQAIIQAVAENPAAIAYVPRQTLPSTVKVVMELSQPE